VSRILLLLFLVCAVHAELLLVTKSSKALTAVSDIYPVNQRINDSTYLADGSPQAVVEGFATKVIDTLFNREYHYFILYPKVKDPKAKFPAGTEKLCGDDSYSVYKTSDWDTPVQSDYSGRTYWIVTVKFFNLSPGYVSAVNVNDKIASIRDMVNRDSLMFRLGELVKMERYAVSQKAEKTAEYLKNILDAPEFDSVYYDRFDPLYSPTVIAEKRGAVDDSMVIVSCHYDTNAEGDPGADDNGSGTSGALEIARIISKFKTNRTVRILFFSGEEHGLYGSRTYVKSLSQEEISSIVGFINLDMIGYLKKGRKIEVQVLSDSRCRPIYDRFSAVTKTYIPDISVFDGYYSPMSMYHDGKSFWNYSIPGISLSDDEDPATEPHPVYHTKADTIGMGVNSPEFFTANVKAAAVFTADLAGISESSRIITHSVVRKSLLALQGCNLTVELGQPEAVLTIYDLKGKQLMQSAVKNGSSIDLSQFAHMMILSSIQLNDRIETARFKL